MVAQGDAGESTFHGLQTVGREQREDPEETLRQGNRLDQRLQGIRFK